MTDADALQFLTDWLCDPTVELSEQERGSLARVLMLATASVATMKRNTELEALNDRLQAALIKQALL